MSKFSWKRLWCFLFHFDGKFTPYKDAKGWEFQAWTCCKCGERWD
jgi:hypothetical protein